MLILLQLMMLLLILSISGSFNIMSNQETSQAVPKSDAEPCSDLVVVQSQPGVPVLVSPKRCDRHDTQSVNVEMSIVNTSGKPISDFRIRGRMEFTDYKEPETDKLMVETKYEAGKALQPGLSDRGFI